MMERPLPLVSVGKAVAGTVIIAVLMVLLLPLAPLLLLFLPLPVAYVVARHGWVSGLVVAGVSAALVYFGAGAGTGILSFLVIASTGITLGWALRSGWRFPRSLAVISGSLLAALVVFGLILWLGFGIGFTQFKAEWSQSAADLSSMYSQIGVSAATSNTLVSYYRGLIDVLPYLVPGLVGMMVVLMASATTGLAYLVFPRLRKPQAVGLSLSTFRLHWGLAYVSIVGLAMLLFTRNGEGWRAVVFYAGIDLLLVSQTLFFLQALGVLRWLGAARQWGSGPRTLVFISAVVGQFFQLTGLMGLLDTWIDYRKRFALKTP
jgi:uncharacterized protein YybS (DUF2232 family)